MRNMVSFTFLEMFKKKIFYITLLLTTIFLGLYGTAIHFAYNSLQNDSGIIKVTVSGQLISLGMYAIGFIVAFFAMFVSVGSISYECEQGLYDTIISKPIPRYKILIGRWLGIVCALVIYTAFLFIAVLGLNMILGKEISINFYSISIIKSLIVFELLPIILITVGMFFSTLTSTIISGITLVVLYMCGMIGGLLEQIGNVLNGNIKEVFINIGILTSLVMPSDIIYRKATSILFTTKTGIALSAEGMIGASVQPSNVMFIYILGYITIFIILAVRIFGKKDIA